MRKIRYLLVALSLVLFFSCEKDDIRDELPGTPTSISGTVKDYHRNLNINNFEIKLSKYWNCPGGGLGPNYCIKEIATAYSDNNGNYQLNFEYNLRSDESYFLEFKGTETNTYYSEFVSSSGEFYRDYDTSSLIEGENNILNLNAFVPIKLKFNLSVLNNHTPPLITGIEYNDRIEFGTERTYENFETFERRTRPNSEIKIKFWYIENYNSNNPIPHFAPTITYQTGENDLTELDVEIDCNEF